MRGLRWKDLDFEKKLWVISIETDKVGSQDPNKRTIVLSDKAIEYLETLPRGKDEDLVFPLSGSYTNLYIASQFALR